ncbi:hypothetical protein NEHOM01_0660 [Nematocida homosporus]|uniref:uncharacterized protein n=1 Tax=Nematocida homosporus TaxID=1912981 RepID=UPI00221FC25E|nr:uncharacterized protein NEHOM01_0660 [Nematocida homosporus]KAI5185202.1 hypothetical protein NEHOM01_0660 [Nematocida homosporus]
MERETPTPSRAEVLAKLQQESRRLTRAYQRRLLATNVRKNYCTLWLRRRTYKEKLSLNRALGEERSPQQKDLFLISPSKP